MRQAELPKSFAAFSIDKLMKSMPTLLEKAKSAREGGIKDENGRGHLKSLGYWSHLVLKDMNFVICSPYTSRLKDTTYGLKPSRRRLLKIRQSVQLLNYV